MNMAPRFLVLDQADRSVGHPESCADIRLFPVRAEDRACALISKLSASILRSARIGCAALGDLVRHVIGVRAKEQMGRIDASANVAAMKYLHVLWDWTVCLFPRETMSLADFSSPSQRSVAGALSAACPQDASVGLWRAAMRQALGDRPMVGAFKSSHRNSLAE